MANVSRLELLVSLGFSRDPFSVVDFETGDSVRIRRILEMAVKSRAMVSIVGDRGAGKSMAVNAALKNMGARQVVVRSADKSRVLISDIEQAMILDLSEEHPRRGREIRARQLRRVLGEFSRKQPVVVVIEEGHRLHGQTLRSLKTLRELDWMGESELFTVVLIGQSNPMNKAGVAEVRLRSDCIQMKGLTTAEVKEYARATVGRVFSDEALAELPALPGSSNFLDLQQTLVALMARAFVAGRDRVEREDVLAEKGESGKAPGRDRTQGKNAARAQDDVQSGNDVLRSVLSRRNGSAGAKQQAAG